MGISYSKFTSSDNIARTPPKSGPTPLNIGCNMDSEIDGDPRSPTFCRTPLNELLSKEQPLENVSTPVQNPRDFLKSRFFQKIGRSLIDPRSPSDFFDRTPIVLDESNLSTLTGNLTLNDSFANFDILQSSANEKNTVFPEVEDVPEVGAEIIIATEIVQMEVVEFKETKTKSNIEKIFANLRVKDDTENKQSSKSKKRKFSQSKKPKFGKKNGSYDKMINCTTPKQNQLSPVKRTPLSCVANKSHLRSKSVENLDRLPKQKIIMQSFDDNEIRGGANPNGVILKNKTQAKVEYIKRKTNNTLSSPFGARMQVFRNH